MKNLSLGQFSILLRNSIERNIGTSIFREFIQSQFKEPGFFLNLERFPKILESITLRYRNPFAHSEYLSALEFESFRSELFYGFDGGILVQLLNACGSEKKEY